MGMTDSGEFVNEVPSTHYLFLQYGIITPFGITYAKPVVGGMFRVMARLVDKAELDKLLDMAEITMAEEAECMQNIAKANAPKEPMHDITSDEKKKGNNEAVKVSEKGLDEEKGPCWKGYEMIGMKKKKGKPVPNCVPVKENKEYKKLSYDDFTKGRIENPTPEQHKEIGRRLKKAGVPGSGWHFKKAKETAKPVKEEIRVTKWSDDSHTARVSKDGKVLGVHTRKKHSELNKEIKSRFGVKGDIPKGEEPGKAKTHKIKEESDAADETNMAKTQLKALSAKSSNLVSNLKTAKNLPAWVQSKIAVAKDGVTAVDDFMSHSDKKLDEKAPPGAKFERMVKHIKKGYSKDGLTAKEKGIAYATAWKAKNKEKLKEKVEFDPSTEIPKNS
jgi:hypothetical protein